MRGYPAVTAPTHAGYPYPASFDRVGKDYSGYVAFDARQVTVAE